MLTNLGSDGQRLLSFHAGRHQIALRRKRFAQSRELERHAPLIAGFLGNVERLLVHLLRFLQSAHLVEQEAQVAHGGGHSSLVSYLGEILERLLVHFSGAR